MRSGLVGALRELRPELLSILRSSRVLELRDGRLSPAERVAIAEDIARCAERCRDLVDGALTAPLQVPPPDGHSAVVADALADAIAEFGDFPGFQRVRLVTDVPDDLQVGVPAHALRMVLRNLLADAVRFAGAGSEVQLAGGSWQDRTSIDLSYVRNAEDDEAGAGAALALEAVKALVESFGGEVGERSVQDLVRYSVLLRRPRRVGQPGKVIDLRSDPNATRRGAPPRSLLY